ncbi:tetratricopeptide repeat protein [Roseiflexus castenholzii]|uniref:tetratricopeptide repeat protein n=1 Tax=Roseiflexus castenholzii TaxID=120962 RepID=UPI003C7DA01E
MATAPGTDYAEMLKRWLAQILSIAPEGAIIALLLAINAIVPSIWIGAGMTLLVVTFTSRITALYLTSRALFQARWEAADALATVASMLHPWSPDALALRGAIALARSDSATAVRLLQRAQRLAPNRSAIAAALSGAYLEEGEPQAAAIAARRALELDPANAAAHLHLAQALAAIGARAELIEDQLRAGLAHHPEPDAEAALRCALAHHLAQEERLAEAALALSAARAVLPHCSAAQRAIVSQRIAEIDRAIHSAREDHAA